MVAQVCDPTPGGDDNVLEVLSSLVDKSLLRRFDDRDWEPRFSMLETIREYAEERLEESGAAPELYGRFFHWALALAEEVEFGSRQHQWLQRVQAEHENVRAALRVAPSPEDGLRLASSLGEFWIWGGHIREGRLLVDALLEAATEARADVRAKGSLVAGELAIYQDDYASAAESLDQAEQLFAQLGDEASRARVGLARGWMAFLTGDLDASHALLEEAVEMTEHAGGRHMYARALRMLAVVERRRGNDEPAASFEERSLAVYRELGEELGVSLVLADMAWSAVLCGEYESATRLAEESLAGFGSTSESSNPALEHTLALALFGLEARSEALHVAQRALRMSWEQHDVVCASALIDLLGAIAADSGADGKAANLTGAAEALLARAGASATELEGARAVYAATIERARDRAGLPSWTAAVASGAALGFEEAVDYALGEREVKDALKS